MKSYKNMLRHILRNGSVREDRTGVGTVGVFGYQFRHDLSEGFPLLTTKKVFFKGIVVELLWFLRGDTNIKFLNDNGVHIWDDWADEHGDLGPVYGKQWRKWDAHKARLSMVEYISEYKPIDQIAEVIEELKLNPFSRRHIVSAWNPADVPSMALPPCHCLFQLNVREGRDRKILDCQLYQRSADAFLGVPFNIASYALLTHIIAEMLDYEPGDFIHTFGDLHIYQNHIDQVKTQLAREERPLPSLEIDSSNWFGNGHDFDPAMCAIEDFKIVNYDPHPSIKAPVAV